MEGKKQIRHLIQTRQLRTQMTIIVMSLVFFSVLVIASVSGALMVKSMRSDTEQYTMQLLDQVIKNIEYYLGDMENLAAVTNRQPAVLKLLLNESLSEFNRSSYYLSSQDVQQVLKDLSYIRREILSIVIAGENGGVSSTSSYFSVNDGIDLKKTQWYVDALRRGGNANFSPPHLQEYTNSAQGPVISLTRGISLYSGGKPLGIISIDLSLETLSQICSSVSLGETGYIFIVDEDGNYIYHPDARYVRRAWDTNSALSFDFEDDKLLNGVLSGRKTFTTGLAPYSGRYIICQKLTSSNWTAVGCVPYSEITKNAFRIGTTQLAFGAGAALIIAIVIAALLARMIFSPLNKLRMLMSMAEGGNFTIEADVVSGNEIGQLSRGFNAMIERIQLLMTSVVQKEKEKRKAELAALQAQINPHFLYNTLDAIVWMAEFKQPEAPVMADALAKLFRLSLSKGEDVVSIKQELEHVENYLIIQKMRYKTKFDYRIEAEDEALMQMVPKLIVQPLVENSIYHGIKAKRMKCQLLVRAFLDGGDVVIQVADDGVGMPQEKLERIVLSENVSDKAMGGIGVHNVIERIRLYYGEDFGVEYFSVETIGTVAEIRLPMKHS